MPRKNTQEVKNITTVRLRPSLISRVNQMAVRENRSFTNMVETMIIDYFKTEQP